MVLLFLIWPAYNDGRTVRNALVVAVHRNGTEKGRAFITIIVMNTKKRIFDTIWFLSALVTSTTSLSFGRRPGIVGRKFSNGTQHWEKDKNTKRSFQPAMVRRTAFPVLCCDGSCRIPHSSKNIGRIESSIPLCVLHKRSTTNCYYLRVELSCFARV